MKNFKDVVEVVKAHKVEIVKGLIIGGVALGLGLVLGSSSNDEDECGSPEDEETIEHALDEALNNYEKSID